MRYSIVIPYRDRATYLPRTLQSIDAQEETSVELVLVDNGSKDNSAQICAEFAANTQNHHLQTVLESCPTGGACAARNVGLRRATGDYILFFDSDDELSPDFLSAVNACLLNDPSIELIAAATRMIFPDGREKVRYVCRTSSPADQILTSMISTQGFVVRRDLIGRIGAWNEQLPKWNDWELGVRLLLARPRMVWLEGAYHRIYQHPDSLTGESIPTTFEQLLPALQAVGALPLDRQARLALSARKVWLSTLLENAGRTVEAETLLAETENLGWRRWPFHLYCKTVQRGAWWLARHLIAM